MICEICNKNTSKYTIRMMVSKYVEVIDGYGKGFTIKISKDEEEMCICEDCYNELIKGYVDKVFRWEVKV